MGGLPRALDTQRAAFTMAAQKTAFAAMAFNPRQPRDPDGQWADAASGRAVRIKMKGDRLKLAGRIRLEPTERLAASGTVRQSLSNDVAMPIVAISTPTGPQLRLGVDGGSDEPDDLPEEFDENDDRPVSERPGRGWSSNDSATTVRLDEQAFAQLAEALERETVAAKADQKAFIAALERGDELEDSSDDVVSEGAILGLPGGGDLVWQRRGSDLEPGDWMIEFAVYPPGAGDDWQFGGSDPDLPLVAALRPRDVAAFLKQARSMLALARAGAA